MGWGSASYPGASQRIVGRAKLSVVGAKRHKGRLNFFHAFDPPHDPLRQPLKIRRSTWVRGRTSSETQVQIVGGGGGGGARESLNGRRKKSVDFSPIFSSPV